MIRVFPNKLADTQPEVYAVDKQVTLLAWLIAQGMPTNVDPGSLPMTIWDAEEKQVLPIEWGRRVVGPGVSFDIYREPKGTDPFSITFALVFGAKAVLSALMPKIPGVSTPSSASGDGLDEASTKGNKAKINDVIPEVFGFNRRYPDYVVTPRRYFTEPRAQWVEMLLSIGIGDYEVHPSTVKSGETPLLSLGEDARFNIYGPGADLSGDPAHMYWYEVPEVGSGSTGAAGLELTAGTTLTTTVTASVFGYNSTTLSIPTGAGTFPDDWEAGLLINVADPYVYNVADGTGDAGRDVITGSNLANLGFVAGDEIEIRGDNAGQYVVHSITPTALQLDYAGGAPANGLVLGSVTMVIAWRQLRYRIVTFSAQSLLLERLRTDGSTDDDWPGWISTQSNSGVVTLDGSNLEGGYRGPFVATPNGRKASMLEYTVFFPSGLVGLGAKGEYFTIDGNHQFEWRDADLQGGWNIVQNKGTGNVLDALGFTFRVQLPYEMRVEVRMKKLVIQQGGLQASEVHDDTMWYSIYSYIPASSPISYAGVTTIALAVRGADRISSQTEALVNVECTRILPELNGSGVWGSAVPTRKISAAFGYIARSVGYSDSDIDLLELQRLDNIWNSRGDYYDKIVTDAGTVKSYMIEVLAAGFGELTIDRGLLVPIRDALRTTPFEHIYDPMNMTEPLTRAGTQAQPDDFDGVDVEYFDHTTWATETVQCRLPGDAGTRVNSIKAEGVTNRDRAWRIGMRQRRADVYRNMTFAFATELDALNSSYMDYTALGDQVIGYGQSAYMTSWELVGANYIVGTSEDFDWSEIGSHLMSIRRQDGKIAGPYVATYVDYRTVSIPAAAFNADPRTFTVDLSGVMEPPFLRFGPEARWVYPALITAVNPSGTKACKAEAVIYDTRVYDDDDGIADN